MGIKDLKNFIHQRAPEAFVKVPISALSETRVAIDANNWMYTNFVISRKKVINQMAVTLEEPDSDEVCRVWFQAALDFVMKWLNHNITPIFVFDGRHPEEKSATKQQRREESQAREQRVAERREQLQNADLFEHLEDQRELAKDMANCNIITSEQFDRFRCFIRGLGMPLLEAKGDGEQLCCSLALEGKVSAIFSGDTDNLVYGCPLLITSFSWEKEGGYPLMECIRLDIILEKVGMSHAFFVDFCILCGTDYNDRIPGYGIVKGFNLLAQFQSIDQIPKEVDISCLKHRRCRELFSYRPSEESCTNELKFDVDTGDGQSVVDTLSSLRQTRVNPNYYLALLGTIRSSKTSTLKIPVIEPYVVSVNDIIIYR